MAKVVKKVKKLGGLGRSSGGASSRETSDLRPYLVEKIPPCINTCPNQNQIRECLMIVHKAEAYGKTQEQAFEEAWHRWTETSPFPSVCGRVCPHPCETECNRAKLEGAIAINAFERALGDFGLRKGLKPKKLTEEKRPEKIAIIGSGPAGMTAAYQLARRGYPVTVFEAFPKSGGMLRYGIPDYRLPQNILDAEIQRILDMGVELKLNTIIGKDIPYADLKKDYKAIFVGLGAHTGYSLKIDGEDAANVYTGTDFLHRINVGDMIDVGKKVVVVGGGDTAIDAARVSRRLGAEVTILYRRTRNEMPAIAEEIEGALAEGVTIEYLAAPIAITRSGDRATSITCQRMQLGEPDSSGRRRPVPIDGDTYELECTALIAAISQQPDFAGFEDLIEGRDWIKIDEHMKTKVDAVFAGGDNINLDIAVTAIFHGRRAAEEIHAMLTGEVPYKPEERKLIKAENMMLAYYEQRPRTATKELAPDERLKSLTAEIASTLTLDEATAESLRCMSCGKCFDCGTCWSFCQDSAIVKPLIKGQPYKVKMEYCIGCKKCAENCPCGYIEMH
ncbi:MAG: NAD(P)-binding protein [candidate division Zixibacteria bacterium]|jgi:NADPH-dependent glutamate synthase beta subunit-like oxidoreductase/Pyruvate/2-oxoacid:ferredoxin oxidoreductase delta subunit|nr:NAD(P)-binding protein [candidate division Zixibacteria bacterium]